MSLGLKMVKESFLKRENGLIIIQHYNTDIFEYDTTTKRAIIRKSSNTTNKMINRAIEFFDVKQEDIKEEASNY